MESGGLASDLMNLRDEQVIGEEPARVEAILSRVYPYTVQGQSAKTELEARSYIRDKVSKHLTEQYGMKLLSNSYQESPLKQYRSGEIEKKLEEQQKRMINQSLKKLGWAKQSYKKAALREQRAEETWKRELKRVEPAKQIQTKEENGGIWNGAQRFKKKIEEVDQREDKRFKQIEGQVGLIGQNRNGVQKQPETTKEGETGFKNALSMLGESERTKLEKRVKIGNKGAAGFNPGKSFRKMIGDKNKEKEEVEPGTEHMDQDLIQKIQNEIIDSSPQVSWDDIAGLEGAKKAVQEAIIWPIQRPQLFRGNRIPPRGVLLFGPPGTGKTTIARAIATEAKATFFNISASSLLSKWIGEAEKLTRILFEYAILKQPSVIFIDEIDSLLTHRQGGGMERGQESGQRGVKTEFLVRMEGVMSNKSDRVVLVGATNLPQELDKAVIRRFTKRLFIPLPSYEARVQFLENAVDREEKHELTEKDIHLLSKETEGYSCADLQVLTSEAVMEPLRSLKPWELLEIAENEIRGVNLGDFRKALKVVKASVKGSDLEEYAKWNKEYGSQN